MDGIQFNWTDAAVVAIVIGFALIGLFSGFINSVFKISSFFLSAFLAVKFHPVVTDIMMKTSLFANIRNSIVQGLLGNKSLTTTETGATLQQSAASPFVDKLPLPDFLKDNILKNIPDPSKILDVSSLAGTVGTELAKVIISLISIVVLFIAIRIAFIFVGILLRGISKLPVFKQIDKTGGFALGAVEGILAVFVLMTVLALLNMSSKLQDIYTAVDHSVIARFFYQNNFLINWMIGT